MVVVVLGHNKHFAGSADAPGARVPEQNGRRERIQREEVQSYGEHREG